MTFKEKLVKLRKLKGLTQDEFAKAVGVSRQAVYKWESGQSYPEVSKLLEMKVLFAISIDDLLDDSYEVIVPEKKKRKKASKAVIAENTVTEILTPPEASEVEIKEEPVTEKVTATAAPEAEKEEVLKEKINEEAREKITTLEKSEDDNKKKPGFFGRLFGRK